MKMLTLKCVALVDLASAQRSQTLAALDLKLMQQSEETITFKIGTLLKTTRPKHINNTLILHNYHKPELCPVNTIKYYIYVYITNRKNKEKY